MTTRAADRGHGLGRRGYATWEGLSPEERRIKMAPRSLKGGFAILEKNVALMDADYLHRLRILVAKVEDQLGLF